MQELKPLAIWIFLFTLIATLALTQQKVHCNQQRTKHWKGVQNKQFHLTSYWNRKRKWTLFFKSYSDFEIRTIL